MTIKATFKEILTAKPALDKLATVTKMPAKAKIKAGIVLDKINLELDIFTKRRNALLQDYGVQLDDGNWSASVEDAGEEKNKEFQEAMSVLLDEEVVIQTSPIPIEVVEAIPEEHDPLNVGDYMTIAFLIDMPAD
jgi:hypothetical protein